MEHFFCITIVVIRITINVICITIYALRTAIVITIFFQI